MKEKYHIELGGRVVALDSGPRYCTMKTQKSATVNVMRKPFISKVVLSAGATGPELDKAKRLLEISDICRAHIIKAGPKRLIPELNVLQGLGPERELRCAERKQLCY